MGCPDAAASVGECSCPVNKERDRATDTCEPCPVGQARLDPTPEGLVRSVETIGNSTAWEVQQG
eukprot:9692559-Ditylum_brightwellii.AAC.1